MNLIKTLSVLIVEHRNGLKRHLVCAVLMEKVKLAALQSPPEPLNSLMAGNSTQANAFLRNIRQYNSCFQMTSFGATEVTNYTGFMPTFTVQEEVTTSIDLALSEKLSYYFRTEDVYLVLGRFTYEDMQNIEVATLLLVLGSTSEYRFTAHLLGISISSVCQITRELCHELAQLKNIYIKMPVGEELDRVVNGYRDKWGFPNCGGAIDGSHIPIISPKKIM
ncbi:hypothetical protein GQR58_022068 [Nymphon striatum]|nr:hypothetical protein GQR58_022068 [Nymphon striatum]